MTAKKVFVTGAGGQTGLHTIKWLSKEGKNLDVWGGVHKGEAHQEAAVKPHATTCMTEATDVKHLTECFRDVQDLFIVPSSTPDKVQIARNYIDAAKQAGVKFVLLLSVLGADNADYSWGSQFHLIEQHLRANINNWCIIRTPFYAQNMLLYKQQIKEGHLPLPTGDGSFTAMDVADVGRLASWILQDCAPHKGQLYEVTGTEAMNGKQMAELFGKALSRKVEFRDISPDEARTILKSQNVPEVEIKGLLDFYHLAKKGEFERVNQQYEKVTGHPPKALYEYIVENKSALM
jgi:uncharacterized protein YbjT (DUF2867 family)